MIKHQLFQFFFLLLLFPVYVNPLLTLKYIIFQFDAALTQGPHRFYPLISDTCGSIYCKHGAEQHPLRFPGRPLALPFPQLSHSRSALSHCCVPAICLIANNFSSYENLWYCCPLPAFERGTYQERVLHTAVNAECIPSADKHKSKYLYNDMSKIEKYTTVFIFGKHRAVPCFIMWEIKQWKAGFAQ